MGKGNAHSNFVRSRTRTPALGELDNTPVGAVVAAHAAAAVDPTLEGATPAAVVSRPLIGETAVAPAPLGSAPVLRLLTPVARVVVVVPWGAGMGLEGPRALESRSRIGPKRPSDEGSARHHSSREDPLPPGSGESSSRPTRQFCSSCY